jgi:hypothetical protein
VPLAVTIPLELPIEATNELLRLHDPPGVASISVVVLPAQTVFAPPMRASVPPTFTVIVLMQPEASV